jgi:ArsR family transcriptional regulator
MDSAGLLDLLGNENRRRILRLLARKPCYVTEISEYLGVSPKAVIDHLRKLEDAGLVEHTTDEARRKYFHIARNLRLEVNVSPYDFATKSAYAASPGLDLRTCRYVSIDVQVDRTDDLSELAGELDALQEVEHELSLAQRWVQGRLTDVLDRLSDELEEEVDGRGRLYAEVLAALAGEALTTAEVAAGVDAAEDVVADALASLAEAGVVERGDDGWHIAE